MNPHWKSTIGTGYRGTRKKHSFIGSQALDNEIQTEAFIHWERDAYMALDIAFLRLSTIHSPHVIRVPIFPRGHGSGRFPRHDTE